MKKMLFIAMLTSLIIHAGNESIKKYPDFKKIESGWKLAPDGRSHVLVKLAPNGYKFPEISLSGTIHSDFRDALFSLIDQTREELNAKFLALFPSTPPTPEEVEAQIQNKKSIIRQILVQFYTRFDAIKH